MATSTRSPSRPRGSNPKASSSTTKRASPKRAPARGSSTKRAPAKRTSTKRSSTKRAPATRTSTSRNGARSGGGGRPPRQPGALSRAGGASVHHLGAERQDVGGIALILLGVLAGLGTYAGAGGPVGEFLEAVALGLLGLVGYAVPVLLAWFGLLVVIGRPDHDVGRIAVGLVLSIAGVLGGLHLAAGIPTPDAGMRALWTGGGLLGWSLAAPAQAGLSVYGAWAVFVALSVLGVLIVTKTPFSVVLDTVMRPLRRDESDPSSEATEDQDATQPAGRRARRTREAEADAEAQHEATQQVARERVRATLEGKKVEQPPLDDQLADPDASAAGREAGRTPDPPTKRGQVPASSASKKAAKVAPVRSWDDYQLPTLDLLATGRSLGRESRRTIEAQVQALQETFDQFRIDAAVARWSRGPTVTRFEIELGPGVGVKKVANMGDDIAYALAAPDVRIVAPVPGKSAIGVEGPNRQRDLITLGDILRSDEASRDPHPLTVALGVDIAGNPELVNLASMPHLLVSGATGSGKSVTLNGMISSVLMRARPDEVRMILVDPKRVELNAYEGTPHLLSPVVTDPRRAADAVQWCVKEMEQRYELLAQLGYRNIDGYNEAVEAGEVAPRPGPPGPDGTEGEPIEARKLPYILLVIDELADLMLVAPRDVEDAICRIAQMARAVGIHMIIATQRPSVDVITGLIKANVPSRLALQVASQTDSRTIIDMNGAEKLVGKGDMLFLPASQGKPSRLQGCWVTERETTSAVAFCRTQREAEYREDVVKSGESAQRTDATRSGDDGSDQALLRRAAEQVVVSGLGSTSMLQRKLRVGFARAGRLMDELEELGVVGENEGSKARDVLWTPEDLDQALEASTL